MGRFATVINCMDGRVQEPVSNYLKERFSVDYVDTITLPGADGFIAQNKDARILEFVKASIGISIDAHGSKLVAVCGHDDCAGNPVDKRTHLEHIRQAMKVVKNWYPEVSIIGLWIDGNWKVEQIVYHF